MSSNIELWEDLLAWVNSFENGSAANVKLVETPAGRGLVARSDLPPSTILINIPFEALLNVSTLRPFYPQHYITSLTSTQWISLHLSLQYRRHLNPSTTTLEPKPIDKFWPFLKSLPREFGTVPLTWSLGARSSHEIKPHFDVDENDVSLLERDAVELSPQNNDQLRCLINLLPLSVQLQAADVEKRFKSDWNIVEKIWNGESEESEASGTPLGFYDFLWGWLNVNSRCVYFDLGMKTSDNLTLAPVIDMLNHNFGKMTQPLQTRNSLSFFSPAPDSPDGLLKEDDEITFTYGAHENSMLLSEYGFVLPDNPFNNVNIDREIQQLYLDLGDEGELKKGILEDQGYWGDMTLQPSPAPASCSWRVLVALRLLLLPLDKSTADTLEPWYDVLSGEIDIISESNEQGVKEVVRKFCTFLRSSAAEGEQKCQIQVQEWTSKNVDKEILYSLSMIKSIWAEEREIIDAVVKNL